MAIEPCTTCKGTGNGGDVTHSLSRFVEFPDGTLAYVPGEPYMRPCLACDGTGAAKGGGARVKTEETEGAKA